MPLTVRCVLQVKAASWQSSMTSWLSWKRSASKQDFDIEAQYQSAQALCTSSDMKQNIWGFKSPVLLQHNICKLPSVNCNHFPEELKVQA